MCGEGEGRRMKPTLNEEKGELQEDVRTCDGRASIVFGRGSMYARRINSRTPFVKKKVPMSANLKM